MIKYINTNDFKNEIKNKKVLVDFYATWCGPCKMLSLVIDNLSKKNDILILKVNVDEEIELARKYNVESIPTLVLLDNEKEVKRTVGFISLDDLESWVNN